MNACSKEWEKPSPEKEEVIVQVHVSSYPSGRVDRIPPQIWHSVKVQIARLLDENVPQTEKESIAAELTELFERLERLHVLELNIPDRVRSTITVDSDPSGPIPVTSLIVANADPNERLKSKIAEFNLGLAHLGNKISTLKNKLLTWDYRPITADLTQIEVCRNVQRNFRRILQKESRFLRDELFAAREMIRRLEKQLLDSANRGSISKGTLVPYREYDYRPIDFINTESRPSRLPIMPPMGLHSTATRRLPYHPDSMKRLSSIESSTSSETGLQKHVCVLSNIVDQPLTPRESSIASPDQTRAVKSVSTCSIHTIGSEDLEV